MDLVSHGYEVQNLANLDLQCIAAREQGPAARDAVCPVEDTVVTDFSRRLAFEIDADESYLVFDDNRAEIDVGGRAFEFFANAARAEWNADDWNYHVASAHSFFLKAH